MDHNTILAALMLRNRDSGGSGLPSGSKPNQYIVTDGEGNAKWEDKLCWSEKEVILEEQTINLNKDAYTVTEVDNIVVGESYVVGYQGKQYNCVARAISMDGFACPVLGNSFVLADDEVDSGEPFVYLEIPKEAAAQLGFSGYFMTSDGFPDSIIASIHKETIHKLSGKYVEGMGYVEGGFEAVFPKQTISNYKEHELGGYYVRVEGVGAVLEAGKTYRVTVDDAVFESVAQAEGENQVYVGNADMRIGFVYMALDDCLHINTDDNTPRQICIEVDNEVIHPIDKKYLPSGCGCLVLTADWASDGANGETTANMTFAEAYAMLMNGAPTVYRQNYGYEMSIYSHTDVTCYEDQIMVKVYAENEWLVTVTFKSDGTIGIPMEG